MHVAEIWIYPVKSCRGVPLPRAKVERRGLSLDRRWMIVDAAGQFVTQRTTPILARIAVTLEPGAVVLSTGDHGELRVTTAASGPGPRLRVRIWDSEVDAVDCGEPAARWLAAFLGMPARLVFMPEDVERTVDPCYAREGDIVSFADGYPLLLASTASLDSLNEKLSSPVPMSRFRPNLVVAGALPWEEDDWARLLVGTVPLRVAKPCARCVVITTDQVSGDRGAEPLRTLATFRDRGGKVIFAQNCTPDAAGAVAVGDDVQVLQRLGAGQSAQHS